MSDSNEAEPSLEETFSSMIEEWQNRAIYKDLSVDIIDRTPDDDLLQVVFDNVETNLPSRLKHRDVMALHPSRRAVFLIRLLEGEVNNGGYNQFYFNPSGEFYAALPDALRLVGAAGFAELTQRANDIYEESKNKQNGRSLFARLLGRDRTLEAFMESYEDNPLNDLDDEFYELYGSENLDQLQIDFIRQNKQDFVTES